MDGAASLEEAIRLGRGGGAWTSGAAKDSLLSLLVPGEVVFRAEAPLGLRINGVFIRGVTGFAVTNHRVVALGIGGFRSRVTSSIDVPLSAAPEWGGYTQPIGGTPAWGVDSTSPAGTVDAFFNTEDEFDRVRAGLKLALTVKAWQR